MRLVVFGLSISSSWGNGHATLWRGLITALARRGCTVTFFERDVPYYAGARDFTETPYCELILYADWDDVAALAESTCAEADAIIITSFCPDALTALRMLEPLNALRIFYDLDTPVTLANLHEGRTVPYIGAEGLAPYDIVLSYTGGKALDLLRTRLGARRVATLYGHADPSLYKPAEPVARYTCALSYLGTYAKDRQAALESLFVEPAKRRPHTRFLMGGAQYPHDFPWLPNLFFVRHLPASEHPAFFCSSKLTLNVTRDTMARMGWCPSGRLFEAASCGATIISDTWEGLESFYKPDDEVIVVRSCRDVLTAFDMSDCEGQRIGKAARERTLSEHTSDHRADELIRLLERTQSGEPSLMELN